MNASERAIVGTRPATLAVALFASALAFAVGCEQAPHPWEQTGSTDVAASPPPPIRSALSPLGSANAPIGSADDPVLPVPVGGAWVHCYGHFKPSGEPKKDVTRLGLLCGPSNGMKQDGEVFEGSSSEGAAPSERKIEAKRGVCYRIFAAAGPAIEDLGITLRSSRGSAIAEEHGQGAWPLVRPDRPVCALEDDRWTIEVRAKRGSGHFALEVWSLGKAAD